MNTEIKKDTDHIIKEVIKKKGTTIKELAEKMGIYRESLQRMLINPSYPTLVKVATALDVPIWQLFASPEEMEKEYGGGGADPCGAKCPHCGGALNIKVE